MNINSELKERLKIVKMPKTSKFLQLMACSLEKCSNGCAYYCNLGCSNACNPGCSAQCHTLGMNIMGKTI